MRVELVFIVVVFAWAFTALMYIKPLEVSKTDLSALFLYWPEAYRYVEKGDPTSIYRVVGVVVCTASGRIDAYPGLAYKILGVYCRFKP